MPLVSKPRPPLAGIWITPSVIRVVTVSVPPDGDAEAGCTGREWFDDTGAGIWQP
jgi:hypothetical protein